MRNLDCWKEMRLQNLWNLLDLKENIYSKFVNIWENIMNISKQMNKNNKDKNIPQCRYKTLIQVNWLDSKQAYR